MINYRDPKTVKERELLKRVLTMCKSVYEVDAWDPKAGREIWKATFVDDLAPSLAHLSTDTGCWVDWSLRHGRLMIVSAHEWIKAKGKSA